MRLERLIEGDTSSATNMEKIIVDIWNGGGKSPARYPELMVDGQKAVDFLKNNGVTGKAKHIGAGGIKSDGITGQWRKWGGKDSTPKTDIVIGNHRISLKKQGGSQLMSGGQQEATATVMSALYRSGVTPIDVAKSIEDYLKGMVFTNIPDTITKTRSAGGSDSETIADADKLHKEFKRYLDDVFRNNFEFKKAMVHEAMTGIDKFGDKSFSRAEWIFIFGDAPKFENTDKDSFLSAKTRKTKLSIGWKSMRNYKTGSYNAWSALRLLEDIKSSARCYENIDESVFLDKIKNWFQSVWVKVKSWISKSWENLLSFFGVEFDVIMLETSF